MKSLNNFIPHYIFSRLRDDLTNWNECDRLKNPKAMKFRNSFPFLHGFHCVTNY